jgi:hypothetical protein
MTRELKTFTLGLDNSEDPVISLCPGHVDFPTFDAAFGREWQGDPITKDSELRHEYWKRVGTNWEKCDEHDPIALPMTVLEWEE